MEMFQGRIIMLKLKHFFSISITYNALKCIFNFNYKHFFPTLYNNVFSFYSNSYIRKNIKTFIKVYKTKTILLNKQ